MRILIAGCGRLGSAVGAKLVAAGHQVYGLKRDPSGMPASISAIAADLLGSGLERAVPDAIDAVVYALTPAQRSESAYRGAYVDGLSNLLALPALTDPAIHWLFVSSTAVYGDAGGGEVSEATVPAPARFNGRVLVEAEQLLLGARPQAAVVRLGGIYGPGREYFINQLRSGALRVSRDHAQYGNRIHAEDAARMLALISAARRVGVYNGVDTLPSPDAEVADWLAARLDLPPAPARDGGEAARENRAIISLRRRELPFYHRYADYRAGYSATLSQVNLRRSAPA